ncbi:M23 family metallopeptidase [Salinispora arenicola]|uniref:M23 family metallopeptidase n=1 Tax=Salinispora arenicola TaxID=168697 RepID=UPI002079709B|nr:peptidoglycan DD-metalloendopeptidase family protein [Salinispora arenicola]MCN0180297.1 peptidoglycan DD-metalloendopeptidase family protein [Salinispora arenicola]
MPAPLTGRRLAYPLLFLLASMLAASCATTRPGASPGTASSPATTQPATPTGSATPAGSTPSDGSAPPTAAATPPVTPSADIRHIFPVRAGNASYHPTHSVYPATDIFADCGVPVVAVTDGSVLEVSRVDRFNRGGPRGPFNGGLSVAVLGDDGVRYYGSHLTEVAAGIDPGVRVRAGQQLGTVGRTGNANNVCHLHFGISPPCPGKDGWWIRRGVVWPAPYLDAWRRGINRSPAVEVAAWQRRHGCPKEP